MGSLASSFEENFKGHNNKEKVGAKKLLVLRNSPKGFLRLKHRKFYLRKKKNPF